MEVNLLRGNTGSSVLKENNFVNRPHMIAEPIPSLE